MAAPLELLIDDSPGELRAALREGGRLIELIVERAGYESIVGNVYLGRIERVLPGLDAAFVDIGLARSGFLARIEGLDGARLAEGARVLVQATKDGAGEKGAALTMRIALPGRHLVYAPLEHGITLSRRIVDADERKRVGALVAAVAAPEGAYIVRTGAAAAGEADLRDEAAHLSALWEGIESGRDQGTPPACLHREPGAVARLLRDWAAAGLSRVVIDGREAHAAALAHARAHLPEIASAIRLHGEAEPLFELEGVEEEIEAALQPWVRLPSGGEIVIERTEALTVVDVNSGAHTTRGRAEDTIRDTNLEAADEIARQIRLRGLAGRIVVDFIAMDRTDDRRRVQQALERALAGDRSPARVGGFSSLGLLEITRRRGRESLAEILCEPTAPDAVVRTALTVALEALRAARRSAAAVPGRTLTLLAAPEIVETLKAEAAMARATLEGTLGRPLVLQARADLDRESYEIVVG
ncbi:MAG: Rne/Rng family ribonuclease [Alphaproteobacteria bacterium]|nr:Rne/Rng family ribonuclease [Alphaproteobacteria bacterium]